MMRKSLYSFWRRYNNKKHSRMDDSIKHMTMTTSWHHTDNLILVTFFRRKKNVSSTWKTHEKQTSIREFCFCCFPFPHLAARDESEHLHAPMCKTNANESTTIETWIMDSWHIYINLNMCLYLFVLKKRRRTKCNRRWNSNCSVGVSVFANVECQSYSSFALKNWIYYYYNARECVCVCLYVRLALALCTESSVGLGKMKSIFSLYLDNIQFTFCWSPFVDDELKDESAAAKKINLLVDSVFVFIILLLHLADWSTSSNKKQSEECERERKNDGMGILATFFASINVNYGQPKKYEKEQVVFAFYSFLIFIFTWKVEN